MLGGNSDKSEGISSHKGKRGCDQKHSPNEAPRLSFDCGGSVKFMANGTVSLDKTIT